MSPQIILHNKISVPWVILISPIFWKLSLSSDTFDFQVVFSCLGASVYLSFFFTFQIGVIVICRNSYATNVFSHVIQGLKEEHIIAIA